LLIRIAFPNAYVRHSFAASASFHRFLTIKVENQAETLDRKHPMTIYAPAEANAAEAARAQEKGDATAAIFDAVEFSALSEMIGEDGVREMVEIFATETRLRVRRLTAGGQNCATLVREMHTLKGAASTVAAPRLAAMGRAFEHAARYGVGPTSDQLEAIDMALDAYLTAVRTRNEVAGIRTG
jgi:HPt (histidine-containing phosphotransfer) domain-containing protein